ncbi:hypothetical protein [Rhizobium sp. YK2]|uniref:hypothetical protein n=1 Tax=Rhizobium sp. YK2 TaxID=1860096 RepID=UPI00114CF23E|nr:hypothetical protein [Rhizobium sp. YK2]
MKTIHIRPADKIFRTPAIEAGSNAEKLLDLRRSMQRRKRELRDTEREIRDTARMEGQPSSGTWRTMK